MRLTRNNKLERKQAAHKTSPELTGWEGGKRASRTLATTNLSAPPLIGKMY